MDGSSDVECFKSLNPNEVEAELIKKEQEIDPINSIYTMYGLYLPKFKAGLHGMRHGQKTRLLEALMEYPLQEATFNDMDEEEKTMFNIGNSILQAKFIMFMDKYNNNIDAMVKDDGLTDEQKKELDAIATETVFSTKE